MIRSAIALLLVCAATAQAATVELTAEPRLRTWSAKPELTADDVVRAQLHRRGDRLGAHPHTDGCSATYSGRGILAVLSVCGRHLRLKFISVDDHRRRFHVTYRESR